MNRAFVVGVLATFLIAFSIPNSPSSGAPWTPELVSPGNGATANSNPPELCARDLGDPEDETVWIRFEVWGGGENNHGSPWIQSNGPGSITCWTDSVPWSAETHSWAARAKDSNDQQSGASPDWSVNIPSSSDGGGTDSGGGDSGGGSPSAACQINEFTFSPAPPQIVGYSVQIRASATCTNGVEKIKVFVEGTKIGTINGDSGSVAWDTSGYSATAYTVRIEVLDNVAGTLKSATDNYDLKSGNAPGNGNPPVDNTTSPPSGGNGNTNNTCPKATARLERGNIAIVSDYDPSPLNVRVQAGINQEKLFKIPANSSLTIISGPVCKDGYRWFEVGYNGKSGWSAEVGPDGEYNLIPNGSVNPPVGNNNNPSNPPTNGTGSSQPPTNPPETPNQSGNSNNSPQMCVIGAKAHFRLFQGLFILEIPKNLSEPYQIFFANMRVPNNDRGVRHDGYHGDTETTQFLGISTVYALSYWSAILRDSYWTIEYPC